MKRIQSIDIFRGLTIFVMVFVNDLAGVSGLPWWMYHVPADADAMTFVDVVFPAFLIIVGMSIPLAIERRIEKGESIGKIIRHVLIRSAGLIVLGIYMVNSAEMNEAATPIPKPVWTVLFYLSVILIWNRYPANLKKQWYRGLQVLGFVVLIVLAVLFKKGEPHALSGMTPSWWGILGLIGWAYLIATLAYLLIRNNIAGTVAGFSLLILIAVGLKNPGLELPGGLAWLQAQSGHVIHTSLTVSGILLTLILITVNSDKLRIYQILTLGVYCLVAGFFIRPLYGISKIYATPTWALYSITSCCVVYIIIYWLVEMKHLKRWANFLEPAGVNPLLTYILPFIFYAVLGFSYLPALFNSGFLGLVRSVIFSLFILAIAAYLTKRQVLLKL